MEVNNALLNSPPQELLSPLFSSSERCFHYSSHLLGTFPHSISPRFDRHSFFTSPFRCATSLFLALSPRFHPSPHPCNSQTCPLDSSARSDTFPVQPFVFMHELTVPKAATGLSCLAWRFMEPGSSSSHWGNQKLTLEWTVLAACCGEYIHAVPWWPVDGSTRWHLVVALGLSTQPPPRYFLHRTAAADARLPVWECLYGLHPDSGHSLLQHLAYNKP